MRRDDSERERGAPRGGRGGAGGRRGGGRDPEGRPVVQGRPRKTAEELDAEMTDYWGPGTVAPNAGGAMQGQGQNGFEKSNGAQTGVADANAGGSAGVTAPAAALDDDIDMIE